MREKALAQYLNLTPVPCPCGGVAVNVPVRRAGILLVTFHMCLTQSEGCAWHEAGDHKPARGGGIEAGCTGGRRCTCTGRLYRESAD